MRSAKLIAGCGSYSTRGGAKLTQRFTFVGATVTSTGCINVRAAAATSSLACQPFSRRRSTHIQEYFDGGDFPCLSRTRSAAKIKKSQKKCLPPAQKNYFDPPIYLISERPEGARTRSRNNTLPNRVNPSIAHLRPSSFQHLTWPPKKKFGPCLDCRARPHKPQWPCEHAKM